ncbi:MAG: RecX family transcriptional regulator [Bacteroidetes bacterium]|nr:RecX family transcriptional regulator [Bacteroidota bacterium]
MTTNEQIPELLKARIEHYCAVQERCVLEVKQKLVEWKIREKLIPLVIEQLKKDNFINEERFVKAFARGKFRISKWGRNKIIYALRQKGMPELYIAIGLEEIDPQEYLKALENLISKKAASLKGMEPAIRAGKLARFAIARGFESELVWKILKKRIL